MESGDVGSDAKLEKQLSQICRDFMNRVTKLDELVAPGNSFLASFQQGLEFLRRPPLDRRSELFESIVKVNEISRLNSYFDAGWFMNNHAKKNLIKSKTLLSEMKSLEVATTTIEALNEFSSAGYLLSGQECIMDQEKIVSAQNMEVLSKELGSYCIMWSLRPYIDDKMMQEVLGFCRMAVIQSR